MAAPTTSAPDAPSVPVLEIEQLTGSIGAVVRGLDPRDVDATTARALREVLAEHGVLVLRAPGMTVDDQIEFAASFGPSVGHPVREHMLGAPGDPVDVVENHPDRPSQDDQHFHTDYSFHTHIPGLAILRPEVLPSRGGDTIWSSTTGAFRLLSQSVAELFTGQTALHDAGDRFWFEVDRTVGSEQATALRREFPPRGHPVLCRHEITGAPLLFVNPGYTTAIEGVSPRESRAMLALLFDVLNDPSLHYRHHWREGDVVMWDEMATVHRGPSDFASQHRRLTRVTATHIEPTAYRGDRSS